MAVESYMEKNRNGKIVIKKFTKSRAYLTKNQIKIKGQKNEQ